MKREKRRRISQEPDDSGGDLKHPTLPDFRKYGISRRGRERGDLF